MPGINPVFQHLGSLQTEYMYGSHCARDAETVTRVCPHSSSDHKTHRRDMMKSEQSICVNVDHITLLYRLFSLCAFLSGHTNRSFHISYLQEEI